MRTTPQAALDTLTREVDALASDSSRAGAMLVQRLDTVLELLPMVGAAAQQPEFAAERPEVLAAFTAMQDAVTRLEEALQREMARVGVELVQVNTAREAAAGYAHPRAGDSRPQFDRVG